MSDLWARFLRFTGIWRLWGSRPLTQDEAKSYGAFFRAFIKKHGPKHGTAPDDYYVVEDDDEGPPNSMKIDFIGEK